MRILVAHSRYLSGAVSGENRTVEDEVELLRGRGHDVDLFDPQVSNGGVLQLARTAVDAVWCKPARVELKRRIGVLRPDVVHVHNLFPALSPAVLRTAKECDVPVVMTLHNYRLLCLPATFLRDGAVCEKCLGRAPLPGIRYRCYRGSAVASASYAASLMIHRGINSFDIVTRFVAVSEFVKAMHVRAGLPAEKFAIKHNFAWEVAARPRESYFIYLGRLSEEKGVDVAVDAWRSAPGELLVVGDGPERARLEAHAPERVRFIGSVPPARALELLAGARAVLLPSRCYEASPKTVGEAFAAGVPVIASDIGALPEFVRHDATGMLVAPGDTAGWVEAAAALMDDALADRLGSEGRAEWERRFSPERSIEKIESIYSEVAASR